MSSPKRRFAPFSPRRSPWVRLVLCLLLAHPPTAHAQTWSNAKKQNITTYMQQYRHDWTPHDTELLSQGNVPHAEATLFVAGKPQNLTLKADDDRSIPISVIGQSILVDGKDLSGNLGSKTTTGRNSPIIEDVSGSQITTGDNSPLATRQSSYTINISLSIALTVSLAANVYLLRKRKEHHVPQRKRASRA